MRINFTLYALAAAIAFAFPAKADSPTLRPVTSSYMLLFGSQRFADTYLTPLHYDGVAAGFLFQRSQAMRFCPEQWTMQLSIGADFASTENPAKNATMLSIGAEAYWGMMRRWQLPMGFSAGIGPAIGADFGVLYLARNGNNPASVKASATVNALGFAAWRHHIGKLPFTIRYQASLPVLGAFFSPDYGQLYYQIYLGDRGNLCHAAWWGNHFALDNLLSFDLTLGATTLRLGYRGKLLSTSVNHLVSHDYSHAIVLGITTEWISLRPSRNIPEANIISAF